MATNLGLFTQGEKPIANLLHTFEFADGSAIDISGMQVRFSYQEWWGAAATRSGSVQDGPAGKAAYVWDGTEFDEPGRYKATLWVGNGVSRVAATRFTWTVQAAVGAVPAI
jgi:hypothetical protein